MLIFMLNSMHISSFIKVIIDKPCSGDALPAELQNLQKESISDYASNV